MHTNHKTQYKPIKETTPEHQKQNQTRTQKTDTERENTNGKRKQPKTAQILRFGHYLKKEYQPPTGKRGKIGAIGARGGHIGGAGVCCIVSGKNNAIAGKSKRRAVFWLSQSTTETRCKAGAESGRNNPSGAGVCKRGAIPTNAIRGGGIVQTARAGIALKKISVQFWQNLFPYQIVLVLKKISAKISEKTKRGLYLLVEFLEGQSEKYRG